MATCHKNQENQTKKNKKTELKKKHVDNKRLD